MKTGRAWAPHFRKPSDRWKRRSGREPDPGISFSAEVLDRAWEKVGMSVHDRWAYLFFDRKRVIATRRSRGSGKLSGNILHLIRQQMKLNEEQFRDLINCPLTREGYLEILKKQGSSGLTRSIRHKGQRLAG